MSNNENLATEASVIKTAISSALKDLHTSMPGIVDSFDPETQTASVDHWNVAHKINYDHDNHLSHGNSGRKYNFS